MEKELVGFNKEYSFSITKEDIWLREGLWFRLGNRERVIIGPDDCRQTDHILQKSSKLHFHWNIFSLKSNCESLIINLCTHRDFGLPSKKSHQLQAIHFPLRWLWLLVEAASWWKVKYSWRHVKHCQQEEPLSSNNCTMFLQTFGVFNELLLKQLFYQTCQYNLQVALPKYFSMFSFVYFGGELNVNCWNECSRPKGLSQLTSSSSWCVLCNRGVLGRGSYSLRSSCISQQKPFQ